jgi:2-polyprenylphenol 6-hydroxylase
MSTETTKIDIAIVGAGLVGSALALALQDSGYSIVLIDAQPEAQLGADDTSAASVADFEPRVSALTPASQQWLTELGAWAKLSERHRCPYRHMSVWDGLGTAHIEFDARELYRDELGCIVENRHLVAALLHVLKDAGRVICQLGNGVKKLSRVGDHDGELNRIELNDGSVWQAKLLVAADGAQSRVRQWAGLPSREWDYEHRAIVATVKTELQHGFCARQRFSESGPLAFLPLRDAADSEQFCSIVWSLVPDMAEQMMTLDNVEFAKRLGVEFEHMLGQVLDVSARHCIPLRQRHAKDYVAPGIVLVGDAAHTIHPLAGQGVNLGFKDAKALADILCDSAARGLSPADPVALQRYQRERKGDNLMMMAAMEGFKRLFADPNPLVRLARNIGVGFLNRHTLLKEQIIRQAMGL